MKFCIRKVNQVRNELSQRKKVLVVVLSAVLTKLELPSTEDDDEEQTEEDQADPTRQAENEEAAPDADAEEEIESDDILLKPDRASPPRLPENFYYEPEKVQAKPTTTDETIFPMNTLSM